MAPVTTPTEIAPTRAHQNAPNPAPSPRAHGPSFRPFAHLAHPSEVIRQFTPNWFAATMGTGVLALDAPTILAAHNLAAIAPVAQGIGLIAGLTLWGFGLWWLAIALLITLRYWRAGIPFNLGWWGYTFPLGVYALATFRLGTTLHLSAFAAIASLLTAALAIMWTIVTAKTIAGAWQGHFFVSPCIATPT